ncbi:MAG: transglycosylase SLT domain-containing protein [Muribaculum sp.]|nr:transglycosylase SLT domain-containing protein [Muribaculaceae bacterium]MCM1080691.1 transglycosylase SLT domain-containing protein [Muribaculum sp.]
MTSNWGNRLKVVICVMLCILQITQVSCRSGKGSEETVDSISTAIPDTLRVGTLYSPTSYFIYRETQMGYDYDLVQRFGQDKNAVIDLQVAPSLSALIQMLDSGLIDIAAYEIPITSEYKTHVLPAGPENITTQVLVQPKPTKEQPGITDVTELIGQDVYVEKASKYQYRIVHLNDELGGGIKIHTVDKDTLLTEDLIEMVSEGKLPLTVVDSDIASLNHTYYPDLDISLPVSFPQRASWGVSPKKPWLADSINSWFNNNEPRKSQARLHKRYFELSKVNPAIHINFNSGRISPYDNIFKKYAEVAKQDWRLFAAQGYAESRFDTTVVSWAGAKGIMQIMPATARAHGLAENEMASPEPNIRCAAEIMSKLDKSLSRYVSNPDERIKFVLAAYNSGIAHIYDAIALAGKTGKKTDVWDGNVAEALLLKSNPEYYNDPVCKYGYFRGKETRAYVKNVIDFYEKAKLKIKK